jgi:hypothetical protein
MPGASHLARFSRDVEYRRPTPQACDGLDRSIRVPYVRTSVRGPKTMGEALNSFSLRNPRLLPRTEPNVEKSHLGSA